MEFEKISTPDQTEFIYRWATPPELSFKLDNHLLHSKIHFSKRYSPELADKHVRHQVLEKAVSLQQRGLKIKISPSHLPLQVEISAKNEQLVQQIQQQLEETQQQAYLNYLARDGYYLMTEQNGQKYVMPDHVTSMRQNMPLLKPVANSFLQLAGKRNNVRQLATKISEWIQQIPYSDLSDRKSSPGTGFSAPAQLLLQNRGDCDSKAVLFAGIMQNIFPKTQFAIVYFSDHAVIGVQMPAIKNELTVSIAGQPFLIVDTTGPAATALGELSEKYRQQLHNQQFSYRLF